jgi:hypothetical protein
MKKGRSDRITVAQCFLEFAYLCCLLLTTLLRLRCIPIWRKTISVALAIAVACRNRNHRRLPSITGSVLRGKKDHVSTFSAHTLCCCYALFTFVCTPPPSPSPPPSTPRRFFFSASLFFYYWFHLESRFQRSLR